LNGAGDAERQEKSRGGCVERAQGLLKFRFSVPREADPRALILFAAIAVAVWAGAMVLLAQHTPFLALALLVAAGFVLRPRAPRDYYGGLALVGLAVVAIWAGSDLSGMHGFAFGPGTAPRLFAGVMIFVSTAIAVGGLLVEGPALESFAVRGPALVVIAILAFAVMIRPLGLVVASYATFMISISASREVRWLESLIAAAVMTAFCVALFVYLLQLPFQLWPWFII
jgi:hypothetical protein